jgi:hypothetical protein
MSIAAVQELIARQELKPELLSYFINTETGEVTLRFESEYWDYKRELYDFASAKEAIIYLTDYMV